MAEQSRAWSETHGRDVNVECFGDMDIRLIADLTTPPEKVINRIYFEGLYVFHCCSGSFRLTVDGDDPVMIGPEEVLVVYPRHYATLEAMAASNRIVYGVFNGADAEDYFNHLGYFDRLTGRAVPQVENLLALRRELELPTASTPAGRQVCLSFLSDILITLLHDIRDNGESLVLDAVRQIRANLQNGIIRIEPLCDQLKISRSYLHRLFVRAKLGTPADFIKRVQLEKALSLLRRTDLPIADVARRCSFLSTTHFATFVRRLTGRSPTEHRHRDGGKVYK